MSFPRPSLRSTALALLGVLASTLALADRAPRWTIQDTGALGDGGSRALVVNNRGDVAGVSFKNLFNHGFIYRDGRIADLGLPAGSAQADVQGINERGTIVATGTNQSVHIWQDGTWTQLPFTGQPADINNAGDIVGGFNGASGSHAFLWRDGVLHDLGAGPARSSSALGINNRGTIVGVLGYQDAQGAFSHGFVWERGTFTDAGTLGGRGSSFTDVNNRGTAVGTSNTADGKIAATIHDRAGLRPLFPGSTENSFATAINERGQVVGTIGSSGFLWEDGVVTNLDTLPQVRAAGWVHLIPQEINDRGWIVGAGTHADGSPATGFVLIPN